MKGFTKTQKRELFMLAKRAKEEGETLCEVFESFAKKYGKASGSVRNFYYKSVSLGEAGNLAAKKLVPFTKSEEAELIKRVISERKNAGSLRRALLNIANGDPVLALRYQNKFANLLKKQRQAIMREVMLQHEYGEKGYNPYAIRQERAQKNKLKREIHDLVATINQKCEKEGQELRAKLAEYEKLIGTLNEETPGSSLLYDYFKGNKKYSSN